MSNWCIHTAVLTLPQVGRNHILFYQIDQISIWLIACAENGCSLMDFLRRVNDRDGWCELFRGSVAFRISPKQNAAFLGRFYLAFSICILLVSNWCIHTAVLTLPQVGRNHILFYQIDQISIWLIACAENGCSLMDFLRRVNDRDGWCERVKEIPAIKTIWCRCWCYV